MSERDGGEMPDIAWILKPELPQPNSVEQGQNQQSYVHVVEASTSSCMHAYFKVSYHHASTTNLLMKITHCIYKILRIRSWVWSHF